MKRKRDKQQQKLDQLLLSFALKFVDVTPADIDPGIEKILEDIVFFIEADRCYLYLFEKDQQRILLSHQFAREGVKEKIVQHDQVKSEDFSILIKPILEGTPVWIKSIKDLPAKDNTVKEIMNVEGTRSMLLHPLVQNGVTSGLIGVDMVRNSARLPDGTDYLLETSSQIIAKVLLRKKSVYAEILSEKKLHHLFSGIQDVVFISSPEGKIIEVNPAGARLFGYNSVEELYKMDVEKDFYFNTGDRAKYEETIKTRGQVKDYELNLKHKDGHRIIVLETSAVIRDENDQIIAYSGILRDVTEKRQLEQQFFQAQKMESIGLMAGGVAHDFNNILTTMTGYAELVLMDMMPDDAHYKDIKNILEGGKRAENLIRQLLAFSRRQMIQPKVININQVIKELNNMLTRLIGEDISIEIKLKDNIRSIKADPSQIQQILVNLVVNAGYAIKELTDKTQPKMIRISTEEERFTRASLKTRPGSREGQYVRISVQDTGIGMDQKTQEKIFEPFFSTKGKGEGSGLGLSTVYGIVKQNNGYVYVDSEPGAGCNFHIYWPVTEEKSKEETRMDSKLSLEPRMEIILFVEDDFHVRALAANGLKALGYKVIEAENGRKALEIIRKQNLIDKLDLVITDIIMPEMGGEELADHLREMNSDLQILLCSGYTDSRIYIDESYQRNGCYFLAKPFTIEKLDNKIRTILSKV